MEIELLPGKYVVAVSGGVDSMVLLDVLRQKPGYELIVAHFDHGIRPDSGLDRELVQSTAERYGLPFIYEEGHLGAEASEEQARTARYEFLWKARKRAGAKAIITAHHQDDLLETAIFNLMRGTGRRGLSALRSTDTLCRPFLKISKQEILAYATVHTIVWREDVTNADVRYRRNYIRHNVLPKFDDDARQRLLGIVGSLQRVNEELDRLLEGYVQDHSTDGALHKYMFTMMPHVVAREIMATWLRMQGIAGYDRKTLERLVVVAKVAGVGKLADVINGWQMRIGRQSLALKRQDR